MVISIRDVRFFIEMRRADAFLCATAKSLAAVIVTNITGLVFACIVAVRQPKNDRFAFLSNVIFDTTIPRESRQPFYDEYIAKRGNGTVVKFWLLEGQRDKLSKS